MSITCPRACIPLSLILKVLVCGWQFHVPVGRGNDYRKELIFDQGGGIGWWSGCDRNLGRKWPSYIYALLISMTINFKQSVSTPPKAHGYLSGHISWSEFQKTSSQTVFISLLSVLGSLVTLKNLMQWLSQCRYSENLFFLIDNNTWELRRGMWTGKCQPSGFLLSCKCSVSKRRLQNFSLNLSSPFCFGLTPKGKQSTSTYWAINYSI